MKRSSFISIAGVGLGVCIAGNAFALDAEYYTYNGFDAVLSAWQLAASIFSNVNYTMLFFPVTVAGIMFGIMSHHARILRGSGENSLSWMFPFVFGITLYIGLFVPKGTLHIYDPVMNKYQPVAGIPNGITLAVRLFNTVERGLVDIINTSGSPLSYTDGAGGIGFDLVNKASTNVYLLNKYLDASTTKYIEDCVMFEIARPGTTLLISDIMSNAGTGASLWALFQAAASPAINTTYYSAANQNGAVMSCSAAYAAITMVLNDNSINSLPDLINARCSSAGFNMADSDEADRCRQILGATLQWTTGSTMNADRYFQQTALAQKLHDVIQNGSANQAIAAQANVGIISTTSSFWVIANEYLPIIRAVVTCVTVGLMPFLLLFITTPLAGKSIALLAGFFVWLTAWGVADALTHTLATNYAYTYFDQIRGSGTGYAAIMLMPSASTKTLGLFGMLRMAGMVLASIVSTTLIPAGHYAMSSFASHLASPVQGQAGPAGSSGMSPTGSAQTMESYQGSRVSWGQAAAFGQDNLTLAKQFNAAKSTQAALTESSMMGRDPISGGIRKGKAGGLESATSTFGTEKTVSAMGGAMNFATRVSDVQAGKRSGGIDAAVRNAEAFGLGGDIEGIRSLERLQQNGLLDERSATAANSTLGYANGQGPFHTGMKVNQGDWGVSDDGKLMILGASYQDGSGAVSVHGGMVTESRTMASEELLDKADVLERQGHVKSAEGVRRMVSRDVSSTDGRHHGMAEKGKGIGTNETAIYTEKTSFDGRTATVGIEHGSDVRWFDTASDRQGTVVRRGDDKDYGDHRKEGNTVTLDDGTHIPAQSAAQMALEGKPLLVQVITSPGLSEQERDAQRLTVAASVAEGMGSLIKRSGSSWDYSGTEGSAGGSIPGTKIGGSVSAGYTTSDQYDSNLMGHHYNEVLKSAEQEALKQKMNTHNANQLLAQKLQQAVLEEKKYFEEHGKWAYGATGAIERAADSLRRSLNLQDMKDIDPKDLNTDNDTLLD